jgi:hypothetical protein
MTRFAGRLMSRAVPVIATVALCFCALARPASALENPGAGKGRPAAGKADPSLAPLLGAWQLTADDETPGKTPPPEVITFKGDGTWQTTGGVEPLSGRLRVEGVEVVMIMVIEGNTRVRRRRFTVDAQGLHLANAETGSQHYVRVKPAK